MRCRLCRTKCRYAVGDICYLCWAAFTSTIRSFGLRLVEDDFNRVDHDDRWEVIPPDHTDRPHTHGQEPHG